MTRRFLVVAETKAAPKGAAPFGKKRTSEDEEEVDRPDFLSNEDDPADEDDDDLLGDADDADDADEDDADDLLDDDDLFSEDEIAAANSDDPADDDAADDEDLADEDLADDEEAEPEDGEDDAADLADEGAETHEWAGDAYEEGDPTDPAEAFTSFTGQSGEQAWLDRTDDGTLTGWVRDADGTVYRYSDADAWAIDVDDAGMARDGDGEDEDAAPDEQVAEGAPGLPGGIETKARMIVRSLPGQRRWR